MRLLSIAISLVMVPMTLGYVNPVQYGIWITLSSIVGWLGYFDIGFGNGLRNRFAESVALQGEALFQDVCDQSSALVELLPG